MQSLFFALLVFHYRGAVPVCSQAVVSIPMSDQPQPTDYPGLQQPSAEQPEPQPAQQPPAQERQPATPQKSASPQKLSYRPAPASVAARRRAATGEEGATRPQAGPADTPCDDLRLETASPEFKQHLAFVLKDNNKRDVRLPGQISEFARKHHRQCAVLRAVYKTCQSLRND